MKTIAVVGTRGFPSSYGGFETAVREILLHSSGNFNFRVYSRKKYLNEHHLKIPNHVETVNVPYLDTKYLGTVTHVLVSFFHIIFHRPDLILGFNVATGIIAPFCNILKIKLIINVDGVEWERQKWNKFGKFVFLNLSKKCAKHAQLLIADSREISEIWRNQFKRECTVIGYGGLETSYESKKRNFLLYVARFVPENSFFEFLEAVEALGGEIPVIIVGNFTHGKKKEMRKFAEFLLLNENVSWKGHVNIYSEIVELWKTCRLYFHGHQVGGLNPALVQAMHCGSPILAFNSKFNREAMGDSGFYTELSPTVIKENILRIWSNDELINSKAKEVQLIAQKKFNWKEITLLYESSIESVLK